mmetsp:Transcript_15023/g.45036  ORF Transcript_15023/g.45036 Transcript_15023/m.45036 type:complete len:208 (+) Transcript_15023:226-849(+)
MAKSPACRRLQGAGDKLQLGFVSASCEGDATLSSLEGSPARLAAAAATRSSTKARRRRSQAELRRLGAASSGAPFRNLCWRIWRTASACALPARVEGEGRRSRRVRGRGTLDTSWWARRRCRRSSRKASPAFRCSATVLKAILDCSIVLFTNSTLTALLTTVLSPRFIITVRSWTMKWSQYGTSCTTEVTSTWRDSCPRSSVSIARV